MKRIKTKDRLKAQTTIFGQFEYEGVTINYGKDGGLQSGFGNVLEVGERKKVEFNFVENNMFLCVGEHDNSVVFSVSEAAIYLANMLSKPKNLKILKETQPKWWEWYQKTYCRFCCDSGDDSIPEKAKVVYNWAKQWNPGKYPENYIECVAFVHMAYNMAGMEILPHNGNAIDWLNKTSQFNVYKSGESTEPVKEGDIVIWPTNEDNPYGHIGILINVDDSGFRVLNSNSTEVLWNYSYDPVKNGLYTISANRNWRPFWWLHKK